MRQLSETYPCQQLVGALAERLQFHELHERQHERQRGQQQQRDEHERAGPLILRGLSSIFAKGESSRLRQAEQRRSAKDLRMRQSRREGDSCLPTYAGKLTHQTMMPRAASVEGLHGRL